MENQEKESKFWDRVIGGAGLGVAFVSLILGTYQGLSIRRHNRLSVKPNLTYISNFHSKYKPSSRGNFWIHLDFINRGLGTANIYSIHYFLDKEEKTLEDVLNVLDPSEKDKKSGKALDYNVVHRSDALFINNRGFPINPEGGIRIYAEIDGEINYKNVPIAKAQKDLEKKWSRIGMVLCYSSTYKEADQVTYDPNNALAKLNLDKSPHAFCKEQHKKRKDLEFPSYGIEYWLELNWIWLVGLTVFLLLGILIGRYVFYKKKPSKVSEAPVNAEPPALNSNGAVPFELTKKVTEDISIPNNNQTPS